MRGLPLVQDFLAEGSWAYSLAQFFLGLVTAVLGRWV